ncbi:MAG: transcription elongation factor GreAB [Halothiobacillus sp. 24-54-40]|jgi:alpha-1,3-rhamnosyl/mannosyltransferase|nr:MAG: transcription elongation factor GreAB [Halothiobacillus sp. 35-54-62]OYZ87691.1 MAG: transcription elongation factor GreAB [Halothiobacillus sp. 24-54-40]OZA81473.1 MAG: transcription elongation factor GreAB [Halothiobacillus sp. 39-53-45]HQS02831.1 glycosyltransferase family 1 protein [Halothiobacillus sp.]
MKLVLSVEALTPPLSGIGRYSWELAQRMRHRPEIDSIGFYRNGHWIAEPASLLAPAAKKCPFHFQPPRWLRKIKSQIKCRGAVFHGPNFFLPPCADIGVVTIHDLSVFKFPETHPIERLRHFERDFTRSMAKATHLITDTETIRQEVIEFLGWPEDRISSVSLGVSEKFSPQSPAALQLVLSRYGLEPGGYCLCVSTLEPRKRIDRLLDAYALLPLTLRTRFPLTLIGPEGWLNESLLKMIDQGQRAGWLKHLGFVPEDDLPLLFAGARLFVYPSIYEGFGLPVIEAMASGVPVVTSDRSCLPEVTQGAALLVDPDAIEVFALAIERGLFDEGWRLMAINQGLITARGYSWNRCVAETVSVYQNLAN